MRDESIGESAGLTSRVRFTRFRTRSGSEYLVDHKERLWRRSTNPDSPLLRTTNGVYLRITDIVVGEPVVFICPPLAEGPGIRVIVTTRVERVECE